MSRLRSVKARYACQAPSIICVKARDACQAPSICVKARDACQAPSICVKARDACQAPSICVVMIIIIMNKSQETTVFHGRQKLTSAKKLRLEK